jgi:hypothetical protein
LRGIGDLIADSQRFCLLGGSGAARVEGIDISREMISGATLLELTREVSFTATKIQDALRVNRFAPGQKEGASREIRKKPRFGSFPILR